MSRKHAPRAGHDPGGLAQEDEVVDVVPRVYITQERQLMALVREIGDGSEPTLIDEMGAVAKIAKVGKHGRHREGKVPLLDLDQQVGSPPFDRLPRTLED